MKKLSYEQFCKEVEKLRKKAKKISDISGHMMVVIFTRVKPKRGKKK